MRVIQISDTRRQLSLLSPADAASSTIQLRGAPQREKLEEIDPLTETSRDGRRYTHPPTFRYDKMMLATCTRTMGGRLLRPSVTVAARGVQTLGDAKATANCAWKKSCYSGIDYTINEDCAVIEAVEKLAAYNVGALVTTDAQGK